MDWRQFIADLVKALAWPVTTVVLAALFRDQIGRALLSLTRLKYKDLELDFGRELKQLEKEAKAIDIQPRLQKSVAPGKRDSSELLREAEQLARAFPEAAVAVAWQDVEDELMQAVMRLAISPDSPAYLSSVKIAQLLREQGAIDTPTFNLLNRMRNLRNMAVHGGRRASVATDEALEFISLARGIVERLKSLHRN